MMCYVATIGHDPKTFLDKRTDGKKKVAARLVHGWMVESCAAKDRRPAGKSNWPCVYNKLETETVLKPIKFLALRFRKFMNTLSVSSFNKNCNEFVFARITDASMESLPNEIVERILRSDEISFHDLVAFSSTCARCISFLRCSQRTFSSLL